MRRPLLALCAGLLLGAPGLAAQTTFKARAADITFGGWLQTQYAQSSVGSYVDQFFFRRARINLDIGINDFFDARVQHEFAGSGGAGLRDAWVRFNFDPAFRLSMGQFKRAFDLFELDSPTDLSLIERDGRVGGVNRCSGFGSVCSYSRFTEKLGLSDRDIGLRVQGKAGRVGYEATMTNGTGVNAADVNDAKSHSARFTLEVADGLTVAGQAALHDYVGPADENRHAGAWGLDVQYDTWRDGLLIQAAVVDGENWIAHGPEAGPPTVRAFQGVASWYQPVSGARVAGVEPLLRVSWADPDVDAADDAGLILTPGFMLYITGKNKIGLNLDVWSPQSGDTEYSLKLQSFLFF